jgi:hypothetical protein
VRIQQNRRKLLISQHPIATVMRISRGAILPRLFGATGKRTCPGYGFCQGHSKSGILSDDPINSQLGYDSKFQASHASENATLPSRALSDSPKLPHLTIIWSQGEAPFYAGV